MDVVEDWDGFERMSKPGGRLPQALEIAVCRILYITSIRRNLVRHPELRGNTTSGDTCWIVQRHPLSAKVQNG